MMDKETNRQKTQRFWLPQSPTKLGMLKEDLEHVISPKKHLGIQRSFAARGAGNLREPDSLNLEPL